MEDLLSLLLMLGFLYFFIIGPLVVFFGKLRGD